MGYQLMAMVEAKAMAGTLGDLAPRSMVVLYSMALNAHDRGTKDTPQGCYFRGWDHLALVLGHDGLTPAGKRAVARAIAELTDAGLIKRDPWESPRMHNTTYRLTL